MDEQKQSADILIEFLKAAGNSGSAVKQLEELKNQIAIAEGLKEENKAYDELISSKLRANRDVEYGISVRREELSKDIEKFQAEKKEFEAVKFKVKQDKEYAEATLRQANDKIGEGSAKLRRLEMDDARISGVEKTLAEQKRKVDEAVKLIAKIVSEL
jgi:predicted RNase H-like nuclease (RuvC/YqgF family)